MSAQPTTQSNGVNNSAFLIHDEANPPSYSAIFPFKIEDNESKSDAKRLNIPPSYSALANEQNNFGTTSFSMYSQSPISYNELFNHQGSTLANNLSSRFLFQQGSDDLPPSPIILEQLQRVEDSIESNNLRKQIETIFPKSYLLRHSIFIVASSLTLICFQIILMNNNGILSYLGSGIWAGLFNLFTLFVSVITCKLNNFFLIFLTKL